MKPILAIVVTYKRLDCLKRTMESLLPSLPPGSHTIVVNNDKEQDTWDYLDNLAREQWPQMALLYRSNDGWGAAMNDAFRSWPQWGNFEYVLESNNDVEYVPGWVALAQQMMDSHPEIGILGGFKHPYHGTRETLPDGLVIKDDMPACAWFMRSKDLKEFLPFPEHGACKTRGGNGEDVAFRDKVQNKLGRWICGTTQDWAIHIDGYDIPDLGKLNPAYADIPTKLQD